MSRHEPKTLRSRVILIAEAFTDVPESVFLPGGELVQSGLILDEDFAFKDPYAASYPNRMGLVGILPENILFRPNGRRGTWSGIRLRCTPPVYGGFGLFIVRVPHNAIILWMSTTRSVIMEIGRGFQMKNGDAFQKILKLKIEKLDRMIKADKAFKASIFDLPEKAEATQIWISLLRNAKTHLKAVLRAYEKSNKK